MAIILFLFLLCCSPVFANCDAGDVHAALEAQYGPGKILSIAVNNGRVVKIELTKNYADTGNPAERTALQNAAMNFDCSQPGHRDIQTDIAKELQSIANDGAIDDTKHAELRAKLLRAKEMSDPAAAKAKLDEVKESK